MGDEPTITVTLTRLEARCLAGDYIELAAEEGRGFLDIEEDAQRKLRAALETPAPRPRRYRAETHPGDSLRAREPGGLHQDPKGEWVRYEDIRGLIEPT